MPFSKGKGAPNLFYCHPTYDNSGPCHAADCDGRRLCMLQLKRTQKTKDGRDVKHQDHFRCMVTCGYCGKRRQYEDECHRKRRESEKLKKAGEEWCKNTGKGGKTGGGGLTLWALRVRVTLVEDEGPQPPPPAEKEEHPTSHLRVSHRVQKGLPPPPPAPTRGARTPRSAASTGFLSACRPLGLKCSSLKRDRGAAPRMKIWFSRSP